MDDVRVSPHLRIAVFWASTNILCSTAVENLEALLKTKYSEHVHLETGEVHVACDE